LPPPVKRYSAAIRCTVPVATPNCAAILWKPRSRQSLPDSLFDLGGCAGAAKGFAALGAACLGPGHASAHSLHNHAALELGKHAHHLKHVIASRRRGVDALLM
jgi:hypothetical protein